MSADSIPKWLKSDWIKIGIVFSGLTTGVNFLFDHKDDHKDLSVEIASTKSTAEQTLKTVQMIEKVLMKSPVVGMPSGLASPYELQPELISPKTEIE